MNKLSPGKIIGILIVVAAALIAWYYLAPGKYDALAACLKEKGATFYGAFWCPHCQEQKRVFGTSASDLPYVECSTPDGKGQLPVCAEKGIEGYPTWEFADGTRETQTLSPERLAEITACPIVEA